MHHYKSLIDEGNRLRDDLRSELARARKEASVARAQVNASNLRPFDVNEHPTTSTPGTRSSSKRTSYDRRSSAARFVVEDRLGDVQSDTYMRTQLDRYIRWCDSLNEEVNSLRESLRDSTEKVSSFNWLQTRFTLLPCFVIIHAEIIFNLTRQSVSYEGKYVSHRFSCSKIIFR